MKEMTALNYMSERRVKAAASSTIVIQTNCCALLANSRVVLAIQNILTGVNIFEKFQ